MLISEIYVYIAEIFTVQKRTAFMFAETEMRTFTAVDIIMKPFAEIPLYGAVEIQCVGINVDLPS